MTRKGAAGREFLACPPWAALTLGSRLLCVSRSIERWAAPGKLRRHAPDQSPVSIVGRLAVSRGHAGGGLGGDLLADALRRIVLASQSIGVGAVIAQAKNDAARRFHLRHAEFIAFPTDGRTLFPPIETILAAFGELMPAPGRLCRERISFRGRK